jgi:hypothetical protein
MAAMPLDSEINEIHIPYGCERGFCFTRVMEPGCGAVEREISRRFYGEDS